MTDPPDDSSGRPDCPASDAEIDRHAAEAARVVELLSARRSTGRTDLEQRVAASGTLARVALAQLTCFDVRIALANHPLGVVQIPGGDCVAERPNEDLTPDSRGLPVSDV